MPEPSEQRVEDQPASASPIRQIASEAYIYGYPLVLVDVIRETLTNVSAPGENAAPMNHFCNRRTFPNPLTALESANADTLTSIAFLDLARDPIILSLPDMDSRYYFMPLLDAWTNIFATLGTRTTGNVEGAYAITGPKWSGELPARAQQIKSPTDMVWIIGRTQTNGRRDYASVHEIQDKYKLTSLSAFGKAYPSPRSSPVSLRVDMKTPPVDQVAHMNARTFFNRMNSVMKNNSPSPEDSKAIQRFAIIGVAPGKRFHLAERNAAVTREVEDGVRDAQARLLAEAKKPHGANLNGWEVWSNVGRYNTDYLWRAVVTMLGPGTSPPEDLISPHASTDSDGLLLNGEKRYEITFRKGQLPPVRAFWSVSAYNEWRFFAANPINRYAIGDRDRIEFNPDGSLTLYIQNSSPGKAKESNWLPAPKDGFNLVMRLYWPKKEILDGAWKPPRIERKRAQIHSFQQHPANMKHGK